MIYDKCGIVMLGLMVVTIEGAFAASAEEVPCASCPAISTASDTIDRDISLNECVSNERPRDGLIADSGSGNRSDEVLSLWRYVDDDAAPGGDGLTWGTAFTHLQDALAATGGSIRVAEGVYRPDRDEAGNVTPGDRMATFLLADDVVVEGGYRGCPGGDCAGGDPDERNTALYATILSGDLAGGDADVFSPGDLLDEPTRAENCYHVVTTAGKSVLDGVTIVGGNANEPHHDEGGGIFNGSCGAPTILGCTITRNSAASSGGGMHNYHGNATLEDCVFSDNSSGNTGGGMRNCGYAHPTLTDCRFLGNMAVEGGGMSNDDCASPTIEDCVFSDNSATRTGGAMDNRGLSQPTLSGCTILRNGAGTTGGGLYNWDSDPILTNCVFSGNSAGHGGGMDNFSSHPRVSFCTFSGNTARQWGGALCLRNGSVATLRSSILWGDLPDEISMGSLAGTSAKCINVQGGWPGEGNIGELPQHDPLFVEAGYWDDQGTPDDETDDLWVDGDYHLQSGSPCIDSGTLAGVPATATTDFEGDDRVQHCRPDMGADETPYFRDCNDNGVGDACDLEDETSFDCNGNGVPDECDLEDATSLDCNDNGTPDECETIDGGDFDVDYDVALTDYKAFAGCLGGPSETPTADAAECIGACRAAFDFDVDRDVDLADLAEFMIVVTDVR